MDNSFTKYAVALSTGTASIHLAVKLAGERLYGQPRLTPDTYKLAEGCDVVCVFVNDDINSFVIMLWELNLLHYVVSVITNLICSLDNNFGFFIV